jgi:hypothetical protein
VYPEGVEILVLEGAFADERGEYARGSWIRLPSGAVHEPSTSAGCTLYMKFGGTEPVIVVGSSLSQRAEPIPDRPLNKTTNGKSDEST